MPEYLLPDVGEGLTEAEIVSWKVKVGDTVEINDIVCEIETAKSIVELPSPYAGTVSAILAPEGETIAVGTPIIAIGDAAEAAAAAAAPAPAEMEIDLSNPAASGSSEGDSLVGRMKADRGPTRRARKVASGTMATHMQAQAAFEGGASPMVEAEEP
jgi:2-oxoisovalerate dehydrogenase E2 component (dihydrolipoyl transacylase)